MTEPAAAQTDGQRWLAAAGSGGLPEPVAQRWKPLRVGIVNLWEYDDTEFWFADGRLVLRGGNGAGKTKVLELTTLMLLRGEITPSVLDPFGSQHRSMKFNLLPTGEGDDPRDPSDIGLGYAWAEFGRRDEQGVSHYYVFGLGASARRATGTSGVNRWMLLTRSRPGRDFNFSVGGRPLEQKELRKIQGVEVFDNATRYRARLADELYGLDSDAYDNLTELLKQLRKPKLGERLNPASLSETLRFALPPLATNEVNQLAEGWDRLEQLRTAVETTKRAATLVAQFVRQSWRPWAATVVRRRADALTQATSELDKTTALRKKAEEDLQLAESEVRRVTGELETQRREKVDRDTEQRELLESPAYQDAVAAASRVENLRARVAWLRNQLERERKRARELTATVGRAGDAVEKVRAKVGEAEGQVARSASAISGVAEAAGLGRSTEQHLPGRDLAALRMELDRRLERFDRHRELRGVFEAAERVAERSAVQVDDRRTELDEAVDAEEDARTAVEGSVETLRTRVREWAAALTVARTTEEQVEDWCDLVAELAVPDGGTGAISPAAAIRTHLDGRRAGLDRQAENLRAERGPLETESQAISAELDRTRATEDSPPPPPALWARQERPALSTSSGAPFWQSVQPRSSVPADMLDLIEATLAASGLLDAWLTPDGVLLDAEGNERIDVQLSASGRTEGSGAGLGAVLEPTPAGGVPTEAVAAVLSGIGWHDRRSDDQSAQTWLASDGTWRLGPLTGRAAPSRPASYLGATARQAARARAIADLEGRLAQITRRIADLDAALAGVADKLAKLQDEIRLVPLERPVTDAVATLTDRTERRTKSESRLAKAMAEQRETETARDAAWATFADHAARFGLPLQGLDAVARALAAYGKAIGQLAAAGAVLAAHLSAFEAAESTFVEQRGHLESAEGDVAELDGDLRQAGIRLETAEQSLGADHQDLLRRRDELDGVLAQLSTAIDGLNGRLTESRVDAKSAEGILQQHEERRAQAEHDRDTALLAWWETADAGLLAPLGLSIPDRQVVETGRDSARSARRELGAVADEAAVDRAWRKCVSDLQQLKHDLVPNRDIRELDDPDGGSIPRVLVLADGETGWQPPQEASDALAERVREQETSYDSEQQRVLATLLGSTFIEHLKDRLDYTEHTFTDINRQLADHPTRHGHAVRLRWEADPADPDAGAVVTALGQGYQQLGADRQEQVRNFLARKIDAARADAAADGAGDWKEQLGSALDYRRWLRITLQFRPGAASNWAPFDAARHATKSGGEKVVLLSQPLFAAAVVAYNAAGPQAPRWVWLDEAMTGVDVSVKESFMGLTVGFDLDVMLTAHDEWCTYKTVPAVAIYDLARHPHLPGVDVDAYLWTGGDLALVDFAPAAPAVTTAGDDLFSGMDDG